MSLSKLWEMMKDREALRAAVHGIAESQIDTTERLDNSRVNKTQFVLSRPAGSWSIKQPAYNTGVQYRTTLPAVTKCWHSHDTRRTHTGWQKHQETKR